MKTENLKSLLWACLSLFILAQLLAAQSIPFSAPGWEFSAKEHKIADYFGKEGIFLKDGAALIKDSAFLNGIIEFDIAVTGERGFMGVLWRIQDDKNAEEFYIRPHQSGKPDANQYTPVFNGNSAWQLYYGEGYAAPVNYKFNEWMHIKIVIAGQQAEIYIMDMEKPALFIPELKRKAQSGKVGIYAGSGFAPAYFANFSYKTIENPQLKSAPVKKDTAPNGTIMSWQVSNPFDGSTLDNSYSLKKDDIKDLKWTKLESENTGITNLARIEGPSDKKRTVFAKLDISSDKQQTRALQFGYSDNVLVFVNGQLVYGGTNMYSSRDHRYLGTIGLFDMIYPQLKKGQNEILFAVTENFGGWGILAFFEDMEDIELNQ